MTLHTGAAHVAGWGPAAVRKCSLQSLSALRLQSGYAGKVLPSAETTAITIPAEGQHSASIVQPQFAETAVSPGSLAIRLRRLTEERNELQQELQVELPTSAELMQMMMMMMKMEAVCDAVW